MKILGHLLFSLRYLWFCIQTLRYHQYRFIVFLSRPFAPHCLAGLCFGTVMVTHYLSTGMPPLSSELALLDNARALFMWLQYGEDKFWWKVIDVPLLCLGLFCQLPQIIFRRYIAIRDSMKKPLRPLRSIKPPKLTHKIVVPAKYAARRLKRVKHAELYEIPVTVQALLTKAI